MEPIHIRNTLYLPVPLVGIFPKRDLTPMEAWIRLRGAIIDRGLYIYCCPIIEWLRVALTLKTGDNKSPLTIMRPTVPMADGDLLRHQHHMITRHLPRMDPALQRFQGSLITNHIGYVAV